MVSREEIEEVADNARLDLSDEEIEEFKDDLEDILDAFSTLDEIDTGDVEPSLHPIEIDREARKDEPEKPLSQEEALRNTENRENGYFKGPRSV
ncbi:MAG: Asp-tRNA(Asn)/Glu-tRNA(Gln) amidotransferase subunit GatC [Candidatus Nanohaloarchaea archaeon]